MPIFTHRFPNPKGKYSAYKTSIREDFRFCCAYCLIPEFLAAGVEGFQLDHHKPQSLFPKDIDKYANIYYSCMPCNRIKHHKWPSAELQKKGFRFFDSTREDFDSHFEELDDGFWVPLTPAAEYTVEKIGLNRNHLLYIRCKLRRLSMRKKGYPIDWQTVNEAMIHDLLFL